MRARHVLTLGRIHPYAVPDRHLELAAIRVEHVKEQEQETHKSKKKKRKPTGRS